MKTKFKPEDRNIWKDEEIIKLFFAISPKDDFDYTLSSGDGFWSRVLKYVNNKRHGIV